MGVTVRTVAVLSAVSGLAGLALVVVGVGLVYPPAALVLSGLAFLGACAFLLTRDLSQGVRR